MPKRLQCVGKFGRVMSVDGVRAGEDGDAKVSAVRYTEQRLTKEQREQVRENIGIVQSDWSKNDDTAMDYVKNRTHYAERPTILPETTVKRNAQLPCLIEGTDTIVMLYDGVEYVCAVEYKTADELGEAFDAYQASNGLCILQQPVGGGYTLFLCIGNDEHTISILDRNLVYHTLPVEYLPEGVPYLVDDGLVEVLAETSLADENGEFGLEADITLEAGKTYTVIYNGKKYECVAVDGAALGEDGMVALGNADLAMGTGDTGEPFIVANMPGQGCIILDTNGATSCTIAIYQGGKALRKLPNELLDLEWLPTTEREVIVPKAVIDGGKATDSNVKRSRFVVGETVIVVWDGVEYACEVTIAEEGTLDEFMQIGTLNPFMFSSFGDGLNGSVNCSDTGTHTYSIYRNVPNKMPEEYLPDSVVLNHDTVQIAALIEADMLPAVHENGAILTDENGNIILRY